MAAGWAATGRGACVLGLALLGAVVAWRLSESTYRSEIEAICQGEIASGLSMRSDIARVTERVRARLRTPEGNLFFSSLRDTPVERRADRLRAAGRVLGIQACPLADSYSGLAIEARYRSDMQRLCSYVTFPGIAELDGPARVAVLEAWIEENAGSPRTRDLAIGLRTSGTPSENARLLRDAANEVDVLTCDVANGLENQPTGSCSAP
jgi:hypothetical protein